MKKNILKTGLFLSILFLTNCAFASEFQEINYVIKDGYSDFTCKNANDVIDSVGLDKVEARILGKIYKNDSTDIRLSRIESEIFGAIQSGSFAKRMNMINAYYNKCLIASIGSYSMRSRGGFSNYGYGNYYRNPYTGYFSRRKYGTLTGFSPPVNWSGYQNPYYYRGYYNNYYNNGGIYNNPNYYYRESLFTKIKNAFSKDDNQNGYNYYSNANPIQNGNYTGLNSQTGKRKSINLFDNNSGVSGGEYQNGYGFQSENNSGGGASVTIID